jgi:hypothetical protein
MPPVRNATNTRTPGPCPHFYPTRNESFQGNIVSSVLHWTAVAVAVDALAELALR